MGIFKNGTRYKIEAENYNGEFIFSEIGADVWRPTHLILLTKKINEKAIK